MSCLINLRHPIAMRRQLRFVYSFSPHVSPARHIHSRRRFYLEQLSCPAPRMRLPLACLTRQSFLMCLLLSGHHITTPPARNERSNRGACSPRTLDSRRSLDAHESPAVAGCPSCLAETYASFLAHAHCSRRLATAHGARTLWRDVESDCMCVVVQGPQASG
mgnify:CR=1 FL=1